MFNPETGKPKIVRLPNQMASRLTDALYERIQKWWFNAQGNPTAQQEIIAAWEEVQGLQAAINDMQAKLFAEMDKRIQAEWQLALAESQIETLRRRAVEIGVEAVAAQIAIEVDLPADQVQRVVEWLMGQPHAERSAYHTVELRGLIEDMAEWIARDRGEDAWG